MLTVLLGSWGNGRTLLVRRGDGDIGDVYGMSSDV